MDQSLKQQLKQWEATFRTTHSRNPTKEDIKQHPDIAQKYKQYNKSKVVNPPAASKPPKERDSASASASSSKASLPPPPPVFKTPTKPKPVRSGPAAATVAQDLSSDALPSAASPTKRLSASKQQKPSPASSSSLAATAATGPSYILANSPSKLRALAALHSSSKPSSTSSPNRRQSGLWSTSSNVRLAPGLEAVKLVEPGAEGGYEPRKAKNPFASPMKKKSKAREVEEDEGAGVFGAFEERERRRLKEVRRKEREAKKAAGGGGVLGKGATSAGAGWGDATVDPLFPPPPPRSSFSRINSVASNASNGMDLDEVDSFFGSPSSTSQQPASQPFSRSLSQSSSSLLFTRAPSAFPEEADDELLGPSPVKTSASVPGKKAREFKPLVDDSKNPFTSASSSAAAAAVPSKPKLFETSLPSRSLSQLATSTSAAALPSRGVKRTSSIFSSSAKPEPASDASASDHDDLDDDDFNATSTLSSAPLKKKRAPSKKPRRTTVKTANANSKGEKTALQLEAEGVVDDGVKVSRGGDGELVLEFEYDEAAQERGQGEEEEGEGMEEDGEGEKGGAAGKALARLKISSKGWVAQRRAEERAERKRRRRQGATGNGDGDGMEEDGDDSEDDEEDDDDEEEEEEIVDDVSLLQTRGRTDLLSHSLSLSRPAHSRSPSPSLSDGANEVDTDPAARRQALAASLLPSDLASLLSLRSLSPKKKGTSSAKELQVARLLGEPSARRGKGMGLLDLEEEGQDGGEAAGRQGEGEGEGGEEDDDWDEDPEGWKEEGEAMDGYYEDEGW